MRPVILNCMVKYICLFLQCSYISVAQLAFLSMFLSQNYTLNLLMSNWIAVKSFVSILLLGPGVKLNCAAPSPLHLSLLVKISSVMSQLFKV